MASCSFCPYLYSMCQANLGARVADNGNFVSLCPSGRVDMLFPYPLTPYDMPQSSNSFQPLNSEQLAHILELTIKHDDTNKLVTFLCALSAYSEGDQFNISFNAPSSTGKSYIPIEVAKLFPPEDVMQIGYCSPTAFFHDVGEPDKSKKGRIIVDLSRKILIFLDQPHNELLARLRPLLSHDDKTINVKITDKSQKQGLRTKDVLLKGFPSVIFSTAGLRVDEQEATRFFLLSPEVNQAKLRHSMEESIRRALDDARYNEKVEAHPSRIALKARLQAIRDAKIETIRIDPKLRPEIRRLFVKDKPALRPRSQRDIKRFLSLIKAFALLNMWWREHDNHCITANGDDFAEAFSLWCELSRAQEVNLPPYVYQLYTDVILPAWRAKNRESDLPVGLLRGEVLSQHYAVYGRMLDATQLRQQILPMLETAGLIIEEPDPRNRRRKFIFPVEGRDSEGRGGVADTPSAQIRNHGEAEL